MLYFPKDRLWRYLFKGQINTWQQKVVSETNDQWLMAWGTKQLVILFINGVTRSTVYFFFLIFSYDSRQTAADDVMTPHQQQQHQRPDLWSEPSAFGDRAHFRVSTRPAVLSVTGVRRFDAGTYTCRVDFRQSPTVYHHVTLDVIGEFPFSLNVCCHMRPWFALKND